MSPSGKEKKNVDRESVTPFHEVRKYGPQFQPVRRKEFWEKPKIVHIHNKIPPRLSSNPTVMHAKQAQLCSS